MYVNSWTSQILPQLSKTMPGGGLTIGENVLQLVDTTIHDSIKNNGFQYANICGALEKLKDGLEDKYVYR